MAAVEVARLGVSRQRVLQLAQQDGFPRPKAVLKMGNVWDGDEIRAWASDHTRRAPRST